MGKQFCAHGHDTWVVGRAPNRQCWTCVLEANRRRYYRNHEARLEHHRAYRKTSEARAIAAAQKRRYRKTPMGRLTAQITRIRWSKARKIQTIQELETMTA